jgi:thiol-disulfide isomerase/thioredoxin
MLLPLLALKRIITIENYKAFLNETHKVPAFVLMHSPHCGYCRMVHPTWLELSAKFESDRRVIIGEINCIDAREACHAMLQTSSWPTFGIFAKGKGIRVSTVRTLEAFTAQAQELRQRDLTLPCLMYPFEFNKSYPSFVYEAPSSTSKQTCALLTRVAAIVPRTAKQLYMAAGPGRSFVSKLSDDTTIKFNGRIVADQVAKFVDEWSLVSFGNWTIDEGYSTVRRFGFLVTSDPNATAGHERITIKFKDEFLIGIIQTEIFREKFQQSAVGDPSFVALNEEKTKFKVFQNVTDPELFDGLLLEIGLGEWDHLMQYDAEIVFSGAKDRKKVEGRSSVWIPLVGAAAVMFAAIRFVVRSGVAKVE